MKNTLQEQTWHPDPRETPLKPSDPNSLGRDVPPAKSGDNPITAPGLATHVTGWSK